MVRLTDCLNMTIVVDWDIKPQIKQNILTDLELKIQFIIRDNILLNTKEYARIRKAPISTTKTKKKKKKKKRKQDVHMLLPASYHV